jgi:hypothetical protein
MIALKKIGGRMGLVNEVDDEREPLSKGRQGRAWNPDHAPFGANPSHLHPNMLIVLHESVTNGSRMGELLFYVVRSENDADTYLAAMQRCRFIFFK